MSRRWRRNAASATAAIMLPTVILLLPAFSHAQVHTAITPTSGAGNLGTKVTQAGSVYDITGGTARGANLFHSLGFFNVGAGDTANFNNTNGLSITNILSRVTGGQTSNIYGTIQTTNFPGANLFLFNPSGVVFGPSAGLNVSGSFHVSTANSLLLSDGVPFNATPGPADVPLTSAPPMAFGFLGPTGSISIQGSNLSVDRGKTLSIVGGDVTIQEDPVTLTAPALTAPGGHIQVGGFASEGKATVDGLDGSFARLGQVKIASGASISAAGDVRIDADGNPSVVDGGTVLIRGRQVDIFGASLDASGTLAFDAVGNALGTAGGAVVIRGGQLFVDGSSVITQTFGNEPGASVGIDVRLDESITLRNGASLLTATFGKGRGGDIGLTATGTPDVPGTIVLQTGSSALSLTTGSGRGGDVRLTAGRLAIDDAGIATLSQTGEGVGGDVTLKGDAIALMEGGSIQSLNSQNTTLAARGGNITVQATDSVSISGQNASGVFSQIISSTDTAGDGGRILVSAPSLTMESGTTITSTASFGDGSPGGAGGAIVIDVGDLHLIGGATLNSVNNGPTGTPGPGASFLGGNVIVTATGKAEISGEFSEISSAGFGAPPGDITVQAGTLRLTDKAAIQGGNPADQTSQAGSVTVGARDSILISSGAGISSQALNSDLGPLAISAKSLTVDGGFINTGTRGAGRAGDIQIDVGTLTLTGGGQIASSSAENSGPGGNVTIRATESVAISGSAPEPVLPSPFSDFIKETASGIFSTVPRVNPSASAAGSIVVSTRTLSLSDGGKMSVATEGAGAAGDITLNGSTFTLTGGARVDSSTTGTGRGGDLNIRATQLQLLDGATISANSSGTDTALAGNVNIIAGSQLRLANSAITTDAAVADGGNISITTTGSLVDLTESQITTSVQSGVGKGGNITIGSKEHPSEFILLNSSQVRADAFGGPGGNININTNVFLTSDTVVSASSALSTPGTINIQAAVTNLSGSLVQLPAGTLEAAALLRASCAARLAGGKSSSLVLAGREGLPLDPAGLLPSPLVVEEPAATTRPLSEQSTWLEKLLRVSQVSLDPQCPR